MSASIERTDSGCRIIFDTGTSSLVSIKKAAYKFAAQFGIVLGSVAENTVEALVKFQPSLSSNEQDELVIAFLNEVIDQDLRESIRQETEGTRNLILAEAFSRTSLLNKEG